ncbi:unnamed protein product, partial [Polarella glacialis]
AVKLFSMLSAAAEPGGKHEVHVSRPKSGPKQAAVLDKLYSKTWTNPAQGTTTVGRAVEHPRTRSEAPPEVRPIVAQTIRRVVCGGDDADGDNDRRLPPERQTTYVSDELTNGARELTGPEKNLIAGVFRDCAKNAAGLMSG